MFCMTVKVQLCYDVTDGYVRLYSLSLSASVDMLCMDRNPAKINLSSVILGTNVRWEPQFIWLSSLGYLKRSTSN